MRHLLWLTPLTLLTAVAVYWTTIRPELAGPPVALKTSPNFVKSSIETTVRDEVVEPILVLREVETLPAPESDEVPTGKGHVKLSPFSRASFPRPEAGRDTRPWMPYAAEDGDLAAQRRLQWARLIIDESKTMPWANDAEETSEPPLFESNR